MTEIIPYKVLNEQESQPFVYGIRWYVISMVTFANVLNNYLWATWGPISQSAYVVYGWSDSTLFWVVNVGNITGFLSVILGVYLVDCKGIRAAMVVCTALMALAAATRIISQDHLIATILIAVGQGLNGVATSITATLPTVVSKTWFRVTERISATAISALGAAVGAAAAFLIAPLTVSMPKLNGTSVVWNETDTGLIKTQMKELNFISFGVAVILMLGSVLYLPSKPPNAPSKSAAATRYSFRDGIFQLLRKPSMWFIAAMYAIPAGFYGNWSSIIEVILSPYGISQTEAGWMSFYGTVAGVIGGLLLGRLADSFKKSMKQIITLLYICIAIDFGWFTLMCIDVLPRSKALFYLSVILGTVLVMSCMPLFLEITCETSYPIAEGVTTGFLGMVVNIGATVFMCIELIPHLDTSWANWALVAVYVFAVPMLVVFKAEYKRVDIDIDIPD